MRKCGKNIVDWGRPQITIWGMRILFWITKATNTHTQFVLYLSLFCSNIGCMKSTHRYFTRTLPVLLVNQRDAVSLAYVKKLLK
jgi:hypothetical protein